MSTSALAGELANAGVGAFFRPKDIRAFGMSFRELQRLVGSGAVEKVAPGLYRLSSVEPTELESVATVCAAVPGAIVCLLSALVMHDIGTQLPNEVWIAIDRKARRPTRLPYPVRVMRFSGPMLRYGIVTREALGVRIQMTSPARTVVDCFRYRNKIGLDVALEALRDAVRSHKATVDEIVRAAEVCRAATVVSPYLEALSV
jgi:predicted transcriptional regulator of viral defense system